MPYLGCALKYCPDLLSFFLRVIDVTERAAVMESLEEFESQVWQYIFTQQVTSSLECTN